MRIAKVSSLFAMSCTHFVAAICWHSSVLFCLNFIFVLTERQCYCILQIFFLKEKNAFFSSLLECKHDVARDLHFSLAIVSEIQTHSHSHSHTNERTNKRKEEMTRKYHIQIYAHYLHSHSVEGTKGKSGKTQNAMTQIEYNATKMAIQWHRKMEYVGFPFIYFFPVAVCGYV